MKGRKNTHTEIKDALSLRAIIISFFIIICSYSREYDLAPKQCAFSCHCNNCMVVSYSGRE